MSINGVITALITPFQKDKLDEEGLRTNIRFQKEQGVDGLLLLGTTGEGSSLTWEESRKMVEIALEETKKKIFILVNINDNSTARVIQKVKEAEKWGVDAALLITPYYTCPSQQGIVAHFQAVAKNSSLPLILYHHPKRTGIKLEVKTALEIAAIDSVIGIKEASKDISFCLKLLYALPTSCSLFAGDDELTLPLLSIGAKGVISVLSNLLPKLCMEMVHAALQENWQKAKRDYRYLFPFFQAMQREVNPIPIKALMTLSQMAAGECRLPLLPPSKDLLEELKLLLEKRILTFSGSYHG